MKAECVICGKEFEGRSVQQNVCGKECRRKRLLKYNRQRRASKKTATYCVICGRQFDARGTAMTCGKECSKKRKKEQQIEWRRQYYKKNREAILERGKRRREDSREYFLIWRRQYYKENRETLLERCRQWQKENREHMQEYRRRMYKKNREAVLERKRQWSKENREAVLEYERTRNAMLRLERHGLSPIVFLSHMIDQRIVSIIDTNNKEHQ